MDTLTCVFKCILAYFVLMYVSTNLLGMVVRGLIPTYRKDSEGNLYSSLELKTKSARAITVLSIFLNVLFYYIIYHYWNIGVVLAGLMLMVSRIPDLLYEMKTGEKTTLQNMRRRPIDIICNLLGWGALIVVWFSIC